MTVSEIQDSLRVYVPDEAARMMAHVIVEDMSLIGFEISKSNYTHPMQWQELGAIPQAEYELPSNQFNINSDTSSEAFDGSFFTTGNLLRLGQCVILGRKYIPDLWTDSFDHLLLGRRHLDTLNEIWWLKFWRGIITVTRGPKESGGDTDFDWQISIKDGMATCIVNLEVKRRTNNINQFFKDQKPRASVSKIAKKFRKVDDGTANVAALTIYQPISSDEDKRLRGWLMKQDHLHALLVWTEGNFGSCPLKVFVKDSHRWVEFLLNDPEAEDLKVAGHSCGTLCRNEDALAYIQNRYGRFNNE